MEVENEISFAKNILLVLSSENKRSMEEKDLIDRFCGSVVYDMLNAEPSDNEKIIYAFGDISKINRDTTTIKIIQEFSYNIDKADNDNLELITLGNVPIVVHDVGVFYRRRYENEDFFELINSEHEFQSLTESNKPSQALRKGIYLSEVIQEEVEATSEILHFNLLRCSSNLSGPTDNFRATDHRIVNSINEGIKNCFKQTVLVNHILAQVYQNKKIISHNNREIKAKIKAHSDKTKDMPQNGIIAFCTFYNKENFNQLKRSSEDSFDWCYKNTSGLTKLLFKLKDSVNDPTLVKQFSVTLYPDSLFLIPLSTNRLYTHEIKPSVLNIDRIPIRMGYVARCSKLKAAFINGSTFINENGEFIRLQKMEEENAKDLRDSYFQENKFGEKIKYGHVHFSMNSGDYKKPIL